MSEFRNKVITPKGMELLTKALAGKPLEFKSIKLGDGKFEGDIGLAESMVSIRQELPINKISRKGSQVTLSATLRLEDIATDFYWSEIGIYAKGEDGAEVLYMYGYTDKTSYISKDSLNEKLIQVTVMVSNASGAVSIAITAVDPTKLSINLINCSASLVIPYLGGSNVVVFTNMSSSASYSSVVYGFEVIEYY